MLPQEIFLQPLRLLLVHVPSETIFHQSLMVTFYHYRITRNFQGVKFLRFSRIFDEPQKFYPRNLSIGILHVHVGMAVVCVNPQNFTIKILYDSPSQNFTLRRSSYRVFSFKKSCGFG